MSPRGGILVLDAELLGYSREGLLGRPFQDLCLLADRANGASLFEAARRDGYVPSTRLPLRMRDGTCVRSS